MREKIIAKLSTQFEPSYLEVLDESHRHNVPDGAQSHFKVVIVSDRFDGLRLLPRHRAIYDLLSAELAAGIHALALHTYTQAEWERLSDKRLASPPCQGKKETESSLIKGV